MIQSNVHLGVDKNFSLVCLIPDQGHSIDIIKDDVQLKTTIQIP